MGQVDQTAYQPMTNQLMQELVKHGYGELVFNVTLTKDKDVKVLINCGKSHVFFIKKDLDFDPEII